MGLVTFYTCYCVINNLPGGGPTSSDGFEALPDSASLWGYIKKNNYSNPKI